MGVSHHDATKLFLQGMMSRRYMTDRAARMLYKKCCAAVTSCAPDAPLLWNDDRFDLLMQACNTKLDALNLGLVSVLDDYTGRKLWMILNTRSDDLAQLATEYNAAEIAFFKQLLEEIITAPNESYSISSIHALKQLKSAKTGNKAISRAQGEVLLASFVANGWLNKSPRGRYMVGARTRAELDRYLTSNFEDLSRDQECTLCSSFVFCGVRCTTSACKARLHNHCFEKIARPVQERGAKLECPVCRTVWSGKELRKIGEDAVGGDDDQRRARRRQDSDEEVAQDSEEERPARVVRRKGKAQKNRAATQDDEEEEDEEGPTQMEVDQEEPEPVARRSTRRRP